MARRSLIDYSILLQKDYVPNWHHELIAKKLEDVANGKCKRLMVFMPPRHGKSELTSVKFPAWYLGRFPNKEVICSSHGADLAEIFARHTRSTVGSELHTAVFPKCKLRTGSKKVMDWKVSERGGFRAVGVRGSITGRGADLFIIDDPVKDREEAESTTIRSRTMDWYTSVVLTRLEKDAAIVLIMTRWHDDDLGGRLLEMDGKEGEYLVDGEWVKEKPLLNEKMTRQGLWQVVNFPAISEEVESYRLKDEPLWPWKYSLDDLLALKRGMGIRDWSSLYQQEPVTVESAEFRSEWFRYWNKVPSTLRYVTTVDLAISKKESADDSVVMTCGIAPDSNIYILEYRNWKANPDEVIDEIYRHQEKYGGVVAVETTGYQQALMHYIELEGRKRGKRLHVEGVKYFSVKEGRIRGLIPYYSNGLIYHAPGTSKELEYQLMRFPSGRHDDIIDALSMALPYLKRPGMPQYDIGKKGGVVYGLNINYTKDGKPFIT